MSITLLLVHNLHCPSCISHVTNLLSSAPLSLDPAYISVSLLTGLVTYRSRPGTNFKEVETVLQQGGFQVEPSPSTSSSTLTSRRRRLSWASRGAERDTKDPSSWFTTRKQREQNELDHLEQQRQREAIHKQSCRACRDEVPSSELKGSAPDLKGKGKQDYVVDIPASDPVNVFKTTFVVGGMTCASCVQGLESALSQEPKIQSGRVTLLPNQAVVHHQSTLSTEQIQEVIEDAGFDAEVVETVPVTEPPHHEAAKSQSQGWWETKFVIEGMTCSSCVRSLDDVFKVDTPGLRSFRVTLLPALATALHDPTVLSIEKLVELIEDRGYGAELLSSIPEQAKEDPRGNGTHQESQARTVKLRVEGMFCGKCSTAINAHLEALKSANDITQFEPCSMASPVLSLTYAPRPAQGFTLRKFGASIESMGPFTLHPIHTSSVLTDLARRAQARESKSILRKLFITIVFAIPTFIIGIVFMSLLPTAHPLRMYFEQPIWGSASRAIIALFILATPVQFGVGSLFYDRAWHSLRGVWKRGGWKDKLLRWGSMDTLVALGTTGGYAASVAFLAIEIRTEPRGMEGSMEMGYFDSSIFLMMFILLGRYLEGISRQRTGDAIDALAKMKATKGLLYTTPIHETVETAEETAVDEDTKSLASVSIMEAAGPSSMTEEIEVDYFEIGDLLLVPSGASVPLDGMLISTSATSNFDESSLTGESLPIVKAPGDPVYAGTTNLGPSAVLVRATSNAGSTMLDGIVQVVRDAMGKKAAVERLADSITGIFVPCIVAIATFTFCIWIIRGYAGNLPSDWLSEAEKTSGGWSLFAVQFAVAVLVVACPCGIGLAAPTAQMVGTGMAARLGIVPFGGGEAFQNATKIEAVCFDKTGTLTKGEFTVIRNRFFTEDVVDGLQLDRAMSTKLIEVIEEASSHPISLGVREFCRTRAEASSKRESSEQKAVSLIHCEEIAGRGLKALARIGGSTFEVLIGNATLLAENSLELDLDLVALCDSWANEGCSIVLVAIRLHNTSNPDVFKLLASFGVQDQPRAEAAFVISALEKSGIAIFLCTGDNQRTAKAVARSVGIDEECVFAQVLPIDKAKIVERLQLGSARKRIDELRIQRSKKSWIARALRSFVKVFPRRRERKASAKVAFIGDGINDVVALSQADVGISMGTGSSVALSSSEFCLLGSNLTTLLTLFALAKATLNKILTNFAWACLFNGCLVPVAAGAFYDLGRTRLPPVWASLAMALSSISVVLNSLLLRWIFRLPKEVREFERTRSRYE